jgi:hypothetical protein
VTSIIDLLGATGAVYRFRKLDGFPPPAGGNFVYMRDVDGERRVVCCGKARVLALALTKQAWFSDELSQTDDQLYLRLNVVGSVRDQEHEDLIAGLPRPFAIYEFD